MTTGGGAYKWEHLGAVGGRHRSWGKLGVVGERHCSWGQVEGGGGCGWHELSGEGFGDFRVGFLPFGYFL